MVNSNQFFPPFQIENGSKHWYQLYDSKFTSPVRGQLLLKFDITYTWFKAGTRAIFAMQERKHISSQIKFKQAHFARNVQRIKTISQLINEWWSYWNSCIKWQIPIRSTVCFVYSFAFLVYFEAYMLPLMWLLIILKSYILIQADKYCDYLEKKTGEKTESDKVGIKTAKYLKDSYT